MKARSFPRRLWKIVLLTETSEGKLMIAPTSPAFDIDIWEVSRIYSRAQNGIIFAPFGIPEESKPKRRNWTHVRADAVANSRVMRRRSLAHKKRLYRSDKIRTKKDRQSFAGST